MKKHLLIPLLSLLGLQGLNAQIESYNANFEKISFIRGNATKINEGNENEVNATFLYKNVIQIGEHKIDAIVKLTELVGGTFTNNSSTIFDPDAHQYYTANQGAEPEWFIAGFNFTGSGNDHHAKFHFQFIEGDSYDKETKSGTPVILQNVYINSYDIDGAQNANTKQFTEFGGFSKREFSNDPDESHQPPYPLTFLSEAYNPTTGLTKFASTVDTNNSEAPGTSEGDRYRVRVLYDEMSSFDISVGSQKGIAVFGLDFSKGPDWFKNPNVAQAPIVDLDTADGSAITSNTVKYETVPVNFTTITGNNLISTASSFDELMVSFDGESSNILDAGDEHIVIGGTRIALDFGNGAVIPNITIGNMTVKVQAVVTSTGEKQLIFKNNTGGTFNKAQVESLLDALKYEDTKNTPTIGTRQFGVSVRSGVFQSNRAALYVNVPPIDLDSDNDGIIDCVENGLNNASFLDDFTFVKNSNNPQAGDVGAPVDTPNPNPSTTIGIDANTVQLTDATNFQVGQVWSQGKIDFSKSFSFAIEAYLGDKDGADGIAIVFHNSPDGTSTNGGAGGGMGANGIKNGLVLELDTFDNEHDDHNGDIPENHGMIWDSDNMQRGLTTPVILGNLEDGKWHPVVITWDADTETISYTVDGITAGTLQTTDFAETYFGDERVYFGFTASTGGANNKQMIRIPSFCNLPLTLDTDNDGIPNHLDLDSDGDGCFDAIEGNGDITSDMLNPDGSINSPEDSNGIPQAAAGGQGEGSAYDNTISACFCFNPGATGTPDGYTKVGILTKGNITSNTNGTKWPENVPNGHIVMDSSNKGFVITHMTSQQRDALVAPIKGMIIYNTENKCVELYRGDDSTKIGIDPKRTGWNCIKKSCDE